MHTSVTSTPWERSIHLQWPECFSSFIPPTIQPSGAISQLACGWPHVIVFDLADHLGVRAWRWPSFRTPPFGSPPCLPTLSIPSIHCHRRRQSPVCGILGLPILRSAGWETVLETHGSLLKMLHNLEYPRPYVDRHFG